MWPDSVGVLMMFEIYMSSISHESYAMEYGQQIYKNKTTSVIILNNNRICSLVVYSSNYGFEIYMSSKFHESNTMANRYTKIKQLK